MEEEHMSVSHCGCTGSARHFPRRWCYGFLRDLLGEPGFLATVIGELSRQFDISVGMSGPHDFAVRDVSRSSFGDLASIASRKPNVRDDRETSLLVGTGWLRICG
jgi:hypothetical protein